MYSSGGLRRNGIIKKYNVDSGKGWIRYKDSQNEFKDASFFQENIKEGFPEENSMATFTLSGDKVKELWIKQSLVTIEQSDLSEDISHVLTVYHPNIHNKEDVILSHALKLEEVRKNNQEGFIYWGKIVEDTGKATEGIDEEWVNKINAEIQRNKSLNRVVKLIVTDFHQVYIAPLQKVHLNSPITSGNSRYELMPEYYSRLRAQGRPCEVFFEITDLFKLERDMLLDNLKFVDPLTGALRDYSPYESNITYPKLVTDTQYAFDDGNNFNPEFISNEKKAHFYDITNEERAHDEETVANISLNLMDEHAWRCLPPLARTYIIEAEFAYKRIYETYKHRESNPIEGVRICMSFLNAIEAILKDSAGHGKKDEPVPYMAFRSEFMNLNPDKRETHIDYLVRDFFLELSMVNATRYRSIRTFKGDAGFDSMLKCHNRIINLSGFVKDLYEKRNIEAHPTTLKPYTFKELKGLRNAFWGINTKEKITENSSQLGMINLLLKLFSLYEKKKLFEKNAA